MTETVEQARQQLQKTGSRVVRATLHEEDGDRRVWFVSEDQWCYLTSDEQLIARAQATERMPLVEEKGAKGGIAWPNAGSTV